MCFFPLWSGSLRSPDGVLVYRLTPVSTFNWGLDPECVPVLKPLEVPGAVSYQFIVEP